jgi:CSLREA domain-containing protein
MTRNLAWKTLVAFTVLALLGVLVAGGVRPAYGGNTGVTFVITKTADTNDGSCDADCSLREAVVAANAASGDDEITLPSGTYALTITGSAEDRAATGDLDIRDSLTVRGAGARATIIDGGGIDRVFHTPTQPGSTPYTVNIFSLTITGGSVFDGQGGGIAHLARGANLNLTESTVRGNSAFQGGGIDNSSPSGSTMTITRSTVSGNKASGQGGGIQNREGLTLKNTTVSGNQSRIGGGILSDTPLRITDSTIAFNTARQSGGGIYATNPIITRIKNTIVSNNKSKSGFGANCSDLVASEGNNLEKGTTCRFDEPTDVNARKPKLGELKNNGGPTKTHALLKGSPAIDAGGTPFPPIDQRGVDRPQGSANDIGAFERKR